MCCYMCQYIICFFESGKINTPTIWSTISSDAHRSQQINAQLKSIRIWYFSAYENDPACRGHMTFCLRYSEKDK